MVVFLRTLSRPLAVFLVSFLALGFLYSVLSSANDHRRGHNSPPTKTNNRPKVFVIGLSKTGTTSLGNALSRLSFLRVGWEDVRSRFLFRSYLKGQLSPLIAITQVYDAFEDLPWALVYQDMAALYPDAKFILTLRKSEQAWLTSIKGHTARRRWTGHDAVYGGEQAQGNEAAYLATYRRHRDSVRKFFSRKENERRLLEFVIDRNETEAENQDGERWGILLSFLDLEDNEHVRQKLGDFPKSNGSDTWNNRDPWMIWWVWDRVLCRVEEALLLIFGFLDTLYRRIY